PAGQRRGFSFLRSSRFRSWLPSGARLRVAVIYALDPGRDGSSVVSTCCYLEQNKQTAINWQNAPFVRTTKRHAPIERRAPIYILTIMVCRVCGCNGRSSVQSIYRHWPYIPVCP